MGQFDYRGRRRPIAQWADLPLGFTISFGQPLCPGASPDRCRSSPLVGRERLGRLPVGARRAALVVQAARGRVPRPRPLAADARATRRSALASSSRSTCPTAYRRAFDRRPRPGSRRRSRRRGRATSRRSSPSAPRQPSRRPSARRWVRCLTLPRADGTNIAQALHLAQALFPPSGGRRVVLLSDGQETTGRAVDEAQYLAQQGVQVSVLPLGGDRPPRGARRLARRSGLRPASARPTTSRYPSTARTTRRRRSRCWSTTAP